MHAITNLYSGRACLVGREVCEILQRMQRAERHERLMRAKLNKVLAELRGGQLQKRPLQKGAVKDQDQNTLMLTEAEPKSKQGMCRVWY